MNITVVKEFTFDSAHHLPGYEGKCRWMHGHTYRLQVGVNGPVCEESGMVIDFAEIKTFMEEILEMLDHHVLNELGDAHERGGFYHPFPARNPTAENMVVWLDKELNEKLFHETQNQTLLVSFIRLWETPTSYAEVRR